MFDPTNFDLLRRILPGVVPEEKQAFTASPGVQEAVMAQGQGAAPGGDPAQMAAMMGGGQGGPPGGGMDPGMIQAGGGAGGGMPGGDPAAAAAGAGGAPGGTPPPPSDVPDPTAAKLDQILAAIQGGAGGGAPGAPGAVGPNGKPATASIKFEPAHFQQMAHKISTMEIVLRKMADMMGIDVPASELFNVGAPGQPLPGQPAQPGAQPQAGQAQQQPPSNVAQQLPSLPPVAAKAAASNDDIRRLQAGFPVAPMPSRHSVSQGAALAAIASVYVNQGVK